MGRGRWCGFVHIRKCAGLRGRRGTEEGGAMQGG